MLNFTKIKIIIIYFILFLLTFFASLNLFYDTNPILKKKVNLGLDLQGGSYLLLEIDTKPLLKERLQDKVIEIKKFLKKNNFKYNSFTIKENSISFKIENDNNKKFQNLFFSTKDNTINQYIDQYRTHQFDLEIKNNNYQIKFSKYGLLTLNNAAVNQSIEIVRRRIDDLGTKEPTIIQRGEKRIVVELPGLKDPSRIKDLLGKTAQLNFKLITDKKDDFGSEKMISENGEEVIVNKKIIMSGENLIDAQPRVDNQSNSPMVAFTLDRYGAQKFGKVTTNNIGKRLAIVLDNKIISAPVIREALLRKWNYFRKFFIKKLQI